MNTTRIMLLVGALVLVAGLVAAQDAITVSFSNTWVEGPNTYLKPGPTTISFTSTVATASVKGGTNGFRVYLQEGGNFTPLTGSFPMIPALWDGGAFVGVFSCDGVGADTIGFGGFAIGGTGIPIGSAVYYTATTGVGPESVGKHLCIDTSFYPPGGAWLWSTDVGDVIPDWYDAPYCLEVKTCCPEVLFLEPCPSVALVYNHCATAVYDFNGYDANGGPGPLTWEMVSGIGSIDPVTGIWSFSPTLANVGPVYTVVVGLRGQTSLVTCSFDVAFTNVAPTITCKGPMLGLDQRTTEGVILGNDVDCDPGTFSIVGVTPVPVGPYSIDANTGVLAFTPDATDDGQAFDFTVQYSDGNLAATCEQWFEVIGVEWFEIWIEKTHNTFQGGHEYVDVTVTKGSEMMWGFDLLIAYDASALSFQTAIPGEIYTDCGWEYFTYRYGANGNCNGGCPSGLLRVVGIAETNNGANHPDCFMTAMPFTLFTLDFLVTDNRTFECQYVPIRFFWLDCGDNAISFHETVDEANPYSQTLGVSFKVYEFEGGAAISKDSQFPTYFGAPDVCLEGDKNVPIRFVDFYNGGIDIVCADSIDARGDLNLNGTAYEISDAVLYSNYFVFGLGVFDHYQAQVAASDVNADGIPLSVADLVYLVRVVVGDALPYPKVAPVDVQFTNAGGVLAVESDGLMGAAYLTLAGEVAPILLAENMELKYAYDASANLTRVLVYSMEAEGFTGAFIQTPSEVVSVELAAYDGSPVVTKLAPTSFSLLQNYPNPFNPTTTISFGLPAASDYSLTIYNVQGQVVETITGHGHAGENSVMWEAGNQSSGVYMYKLEAGDYAASRKMLLIK